MDNKKSSPNATVWRKLPPKKEAIEFPKENEGPIKRELKKPIFSEKKEPPKKPAKLLAAPKRILSRKEAPLKQNKVERAPLPFPEKIMVQAWDQKGEKVGERIDFSEITPSMTIFDIKKKIEEANGMPVIKQKLLHNGKVLSDSLKLGEANIHQGLRLEEKPSFVEMLTMEKKNVYPPFFFL